MSEGCAVLPPSHEKLSQDSYIASIDVGIRPAIEIPGGRAMFRSDEHTAAVDEPSRSLDVSPPLAELEQALLSVLDADFVSSTVVRDRARLRARETAPELSRTKLSAAQPIAAIMSALHELERTNFAESIQTAQCLRWRLKRQAG